MCTPLRIDRWQRLLESHPHSEFAAYVTSGLRDGFDIGYTDCRSVFQIAENLHSSAQHEDFISEHLQACVAKGETAGPFSSPPFPNFMASGVGVVPKKSGKLRLIHHLSAPAGRSVNDGINKDDFSLQYVTVDDAIAIIMRLGRGTQLAKMDIRNAFRLCPVRHQDHHLLGISWQGRYYYDKVLPFGLRSAPYIFSQVADALQWIAQHHFGISELIHLLDDYLTAGPPQSPLCQQRLDTLLAVCDYLGVPVATEKTEGPATALTFLGITLDSDLLEARLPPDKQSNLLDLLANLMARRKCTKRELLSLLGKLNFAARVVPSGRTFMRRLFDRACATRALHHHVDLTLPCRRDLGWWHWLLNTWNGRSFFLHPEWTPAPNIHLSTDAAGSHGYGASFGAQWIAGVWSAEERTRCITWMELFPIVVACATWGHLWARQRIRFQSDNQAVVAVVRSGTSHCPNVMALLRSLFYVNATLSVMVDVQYVPGATNVLADALSRGRLQVFRRLHPSANPTPTPPSPLPLLPGEEQSALSCGITACRHWHQPPGDSTPSANGTTSTSAG